ncbi:MAG: hypothetical protein WCK31_04780 [bacterium]
MAIYKSVTGGVLMNYVDTVTGEACVAKLSVADGVIAKGNVVCHAQAGTNGRYIICPTTGNERTMPLGIALTAAAGAGSTFWMAFSGEVEVLPDSGITAIMGYQIITSANEAGRVEQASSQGSTTLHFNEVGHWGKAGTGAGVLTLADIHFN